MQEVLETANRVVDGSARVRIHARSVKDLVRGRTRDFRPMPWDHSHHFFDGSEKTVSYLLVLDTLNFCFWPATGTSRWEIPYQDRRLSGYHALAAALKAAVEAGIPVTDASYLAEISAASLKAVLGGRGHLQLMEERARALNELGRFLLAGYNGKAGRLVESAEGSAVALVRILSDALPSFRDTALYRGDPVYFYKRAQIFAADLYGAFSGKHWGAFRDMDNLTAFADYKLPQVLRHLGILRYDPDLSRKVDRGLLIEAGSEMEVEIRAGTICAVEEIRQALSRTGERRTASQIDYTLWNLGQEKEFRARPYHKTVTIFY